MKHFTPHERVDLKSHPNFTERWVQDIIKRNPSILGLGELELLQAERTQNQAGRLDLLLRDPDDEERYEVELMLGKTDASHIIRCIEYWDTERRRYPAYKHFAVIVAEDITSRYLNVLSLFSGSIPLVAIQLSALSVGDQLVLHFAKVLDQRALREDDTSATDEQTVDRAYWEQRASPVMIKLVDGLLDTINTTSPRKYQLTYRRAYIGLADDSRVRNFVLFKPRKNYVNVQLQSGWTEEMQNSLEEAGLRPEITRDRLVFKLGSEDLPSKAVLVRKVIGEIVATEHD